MVVRMSNAPDPAFLIAARRAPLLAQSRGARRISTASVAVETAGRSCRMLGRRDPSGVGVRIRNGPAGRTQMREMRRERFGHPRLDLLARPSQREHTVHVRTMGTPGTVFSLLIDDEVVLQRRSRSPVARRIAASVPTGTVSESLPAIVTIRAPSALSQVSCEPVWRTLIHPSTSRALRTSLNFLATHRSYAARGRAMSSSRAIHMRRQVSHSRERTPNVVAT
ncbi:MAG: hypothetical protein QOK16_842 [Solirubrobacteraceae bacterium]|nr:hypothetical protein [Solirubrobacteraceae bacterium]